MIIITLHYNWAFLKNVVYLGPSFFFDRILRPIFLRMGKDNIFL